MKYEIELTTHDSFLLEKISEYVEIEPKVLIRNIVTTHIKQFDKEMREFLDDYSSNDYYDDNVGRFID